MPENKEKVEELKRKVEEWQKELSEIWEGKETEVAKIEKNNLRNLIFNAKREIEQLEGREEPRDEQSPEDLLSELSETEKSKEKELNNIRLRLERLKKEREDYKNQTDLYDEYTKKIEELEEAQENIEKEEKSGEQRDKQIKILTKGRMQAEKEVREIEEQVKKKEQEIAEIEYGTEEAMEEIELSSGEKIKRPKVLRLYEEMDQLKAQLREKTGKIKEYQDAINKLEGIHKEKEEKRELNGEEVRYFHGQRDLRELWRKRRGHKKESTRK